MLQKFDEENVNPLSLISIINYITSFFNYAWPELIWYVDVSFIVY
jgi:hypothetical protein